MLNGLFKGGSKNTSSSSSSSTGGGNRNTSTPRPSSGKSTGSILKDTGSVKSPRANTVVTVASNNVYDDDDDDDDDKNNGSDNDNSGSGGGSGSENDQQQRGRTSTKKSNVTTPTVATKTAKPISSSSSSSPDRMTSTNTDSHTAYNDTLSNVQADKGPPKDGPILSGTIIGNPKPSDAKGKVTIFGHHNEFWIRLENLACYSVPAQYENDVFLYLCPKRSPKTVTPSKCVRLHIPGTSSAGNIPSAPPIDSLEEIPEIVFSLGDTVDTRKGPDGPIVDPRKFSSIVAVRPGYVDPKTGEEVNPTQLYAFANLSRAGASKEEQAAEIADKIRRQSIAMAEFQSDAMMPISLYGRSYEDMDLIAKDCFATLGKTKADGSLTFAEFKMVLITLNVPFTEARAYLWFDAADADGSGEIEFEEFQHLLYIVSKCKPARYITLRDVYFFFTNARSQDEDNDDGNTNAMEIVKETLPPLDAIGLHALLNSMGMKVSTKKADKLYKVANARQGKGYIEYDQVKEIYVSLCDVKHELGIRGYSLSKLRKERVIDITDIGAVKRFFRDVLNREDKEIVDDVRSAVVAADEAQKLMRKEAEERRRQRANLRVIDDKAVKRHKALLDREGRFRKQREEEAAKQRIVQEKELQTMLDNALKEREKLEENLVKKTNDGQQKEDEEKRIRLGLDRLDLSNKELLYLPALLWSTAEGRDRINHLILFDISRNKISRLPGMQLLYHCVMLQKLDISNNQITELPDEIGELKELLIFYAHFNQLRNLPPSIGKLTKLKRLTLHSNCIESIPDTIGSLTALENFHIEANRITSVPTTIGQCKQLEEFCIAGNKVSFLPESLGNCALLRRFDIRSNSLRELPSTLGNLRRLTHLYVSHNDLREFPLSIGSCKHLQILEAGRNRIKALPLTFGKLERLIALDLCNNILKLIDEASFSNLRGIQKLDLSYNRLITLPASIGRLVDLQTLNLSNNQLRMIPSDIAACRLLRHWDLHMNALGYGGGTILPPSIGTMISLEWLNVAENSAEDITPEVSHCPRLKHLNISNNRLTRLHPEFASLPALLTLDASNNRLTSIPAEIGGCGALRALDLSCNQLVRLPDTIADCANLRHLHLYNNRISILPFSMGWLFPQLISFDVGKNPLAGLPNKWASQEVFGAKDVLALRFARERREPLLVEIRRARARDIYRRLMGYKAKIEDRLDWERMHMLREDLRLQSKGKAAILAELSAFSTRNGWSRAQHGQERDRLDEWLDFIKGEIEKDKRYQARLTNYVGEKLALDDHTTETMLHNRMYQIEDAPPDTVPVTVITDGETSVPTSRPSTAAVIVTPVNHANIPYAASELILRPSSRSLSRERSAERKKRPASSGGVIGEELFRNRHERSEADEKRLQDAQDQLMDDIDYKKELALRRMSGFSSLSPLSRPSKAEMIRRYRSRTPGGSRPSSAERSLSRGKRPGTAPSSSSSFSRSTVSDAPEPLIIKDKYGNEQLVPAIVGISVTNGPSGNTGRMDPREANFARMRSDLATGYVSSVVQKAETMYGRRETGIQAQSSEESNYGLITPGQAEYYGKMLPPDTDKAAQILERMTHVGTIEEAFPPVPSAASDGPITGPDIPSIVRPPIIQYGNRSGTTTTEMTILLPYEREPLSHLNRQESDGPIPGLEPTADSLQSLGSNGTLYSSSITPNNATSIVSSQQGVPPLTGFVGLRTSASTDSTNFPPDGDDAMVPSTTYPGFPSGLETRSIDRVSGNESYPSQQQPLKRRLTTRHRHMYEQRQAFIANSAKPGQASDPSRTLASSSSSTVSIPPELLGEPEKSGDEGYGSDAYYPHPSANPPNDTADSSSSVYPTHDTPNSKYRHRRPLPPFDAPATFTHVHEIQTMQRALTKAALEVSASGREGELYPTPDQFNRGSEGYPVVDTSEWIDLNEHRPRSSPEWLKERERKAKGGDIDTRNLQPISRSRSSSPVAVARTVVPVTIPPISASSSSSTPALHEPSVSPSLLPHPSHEHPSTDGTPPPPIVTTGTPPTEPPEDDEKERWSPHHGSQQYRRKDLQNRKRNPTGFGNEAVAGREEVTYDRYALWRAGRTVDEGMSAKPEWSGSPSSSSSPAAHPQPSVNGNASPVHFTASLIIDTGGNRSSSPPPVDGSLRGSSPMVAISPYGRRSVSPSLPLPSEGPYVRKPSSPHPHRRSESPVKDLPPSLTYTLEKGSGIRDAVGNTGIEYRSDALQGLYEQTSVHQRDPFHQRTTGTGYVSSSSSPPLEAPNSVESLSSSVYRPSGVLNSTPMIHDPRLHPSPSRSLSPFTTTLGRSSGIPAADHYQSVTAEIVATGGGLDNVSPGPRMHPPDGRPLAITEKVTNILMGLGSGDSTVPLSRQKAKQFTRDDFQRSVSSSPVRATKETKETTENGKNGMKESTVSPAASIEQQGMSINKKKSSSNSSSGGSLASSSTETVTVVPSQPVITTKSTKVASTDAPAVIVRPSPMKERNGNQRNDAPVATMKQPVRTTIPPSTTATTTTATAPTTTVPTTTVPTTTVPTTTAPTTTVPVPIVNTNAPPPETLEEEDQQWIARLQSRTIPGPSASLPTERTVEESGPSSLETSVILEEESEETKEDGNGERNDTVTLTKEGKETDDDQQEYATTHHRTKMETKETEDTSTTVHSRKPVTGKKSQAHLLPTRNRTVYKSTQMYKNDNAKGSFYHLQNVAGGRGVKIASDGIGKIKDINHRGRPPHHVVAIDDHEDDLDHEGNHSTRDHRLARMEKKHLVPKASNNLHSFHDTVDIEEDGSEEAETENDDNEMDEATLVAKTLASSMLPPWLMTGEENTNGSTNPAKTTVPPLTKKHPGKSTDPARSTAENTGPFLEPSASSASLPTVGSMRTKGRDIGRLKRERRIAELVAAGRPIPQALRDEQRQAEDDEDAQDQQQSIGLLRKSQSFESTSDSLGGTVQEYTFDTMMEAPGNDTNAAMEEEKGSDDNGDTASTDIDGSATADDNEEGNDDSDDSVTLGKNKEVMEKLVPLMKPEAREYLKHLAPEALGYLNELHAMDEHETAMAKKATADGDLHNFMEKYVAKHGIVLPLLKKKGSKHTKGKDTNTDEGGDTLAPLPKRKSKRTGLRSIASSYVMPQPQGLTSNASFMGKSFAFTDSSSSSATDTPSPTVTDGTTVSPLSAHDKPSKPKGFTELDHIVDPEKYRETSGIGPYSLRQAKTGKNLQLLKKQLRRLNNDQGSSSTSQITGMDLEDSTLYGSFVIQSGEGSGMISSSGGSGIEGKVGLTDAIRMRQLAMGIDRAQRGDGTKGSIEADSYAKIEYLRENTEGRVGRDAGDYERIHKLAVLPDQEFLEAIDEEKNEADNDDPAVRYGKNGTNATDKEDDGEGKDSNEGEEEKTGDGTDDDDQDEGKRLLVHRGSYRTQRLNAAKHRKQNGNHPDTDGRITDHHRGAFDESSEKLQRIIEEEEENMNGEMKVVGAATGINIRRLRAMAKNVESRAEKLFAHKDADAEDEMNRDIQTEERLRQRKLQTARLKKQFADADAAIQAEKERTIAESSQSSVKPPVSHKRKDGLSIDIRSASATATDTELSDTAAAAYDSLLATGILGRMQADKEKKLKDLLDAKHAEERARIETALAKAKLENPHHAIVDLHSVAQSAATIDARGGTAVQLYDKVLDDTTTKDLLDLQQTIAGVPTGGGNVPLASEELTKKLEELHKQQQIVALTDKDGSTEGKSTLGSSSSSSAIVVASSSSTALVTVNPASQQLTVAPDGTASTGHSSTTFANEAVSMMFSRAKEAAEKRKMERLARLTGQNYDPRRDPMNAMRTDSFEQDYTVLAAPASGIRPLVPQFGESISTGLWKGNPYARVQPVRSTTFATPGDVQPNSHGTTTNPNTKMFVTVPLPEEITGISLQPAVRGEDPPASESIRERRVVHEQRLKDAAEQVHLFRYVGGVRFVHGDIDSAEAEQEAMYGPLSKEVEQIVPPSSDKDDRSTVSGSGSTGMNGSTSGTTNREKHSPGTNPPIMNAIIAAAGVRFANPDENTAGNVGTVMNTATNTSNGATTMNHPNQRPRSAKETLMLANNAAQTGSTVPNPNVSSSLPPLIDLSRPESSSTRNPRTGKSVTVPSSYGLVDIGGGRHPSASPHDHHHDKMHAEQYGGNGDHYSESGNHSSILSSPDAVDIGGGYVALRPSSAGGTIILNSDSSLAKTAPAMPTALIRTSNPFRITPGEGNEVPATLFMPKSAQLAVLLDKGDHNAVPRKDTTHMAASFQRGYTSADLAEYLRLESIYAGYAEAEWLARAGAYIEGRATASDFVKAVRRRMQGKDSLTGALENPAEDLHAYNRERADMWDPVLIPLVQRYFSRAYRTGLPPIYGSLTPEQEAARASLARMVTEYRNQRHQRITKTLDEQWKEHENLYEINPDELEARTRAQDARRSIKVRQRLNSELTELQLEVRARAIRQHERMEANEAHRKAKLMAEHGHDIEAALRKAKEREEWEAQKAREAGMNPNVALSKRARHMALAAKIMSNSSNAAKAGMVNGNGGSNGSTNTAESLSSSSQGPPQGPPRVGHAGAAFRTTQRK